jgi:hypothetical protein
MEGSVEMGRVADQYVMSFQAVPFHQETRYHWMICRALTLDFLRDEVGLQVGLRSNYGGKHLT